MDASTSDTSSGYEQVFISHRGVGMKLGFASRLHQALEEHSIKTFLDAEDFPVGVDVREYMLAAARKAVVGIPIFTKDYGTSSWCLDELAEMMDREPNDKNKVIPVFFDVKPEELRNEKPKELGNEKPEPNDKNKAIPVFFDVKPEELRNEEEKFAEKLERHVGNCMRSKDEIQRWKDALTKASWLAGFRLETYGG